jgi:hypothetical protein
MAWDDSKLNELKAKYGESPWRRMFDPTFRKVADKIFSKSGTRLAPYSGIPTFLTAPICLSMPPNRISAICRWRSSACRWILASPIARVRVSAHAPCAPSNASDPIITYWAARPSLICAWPISATYPFQPLPAGTQP